MIENLRSAYLSCTLIFLCFLCQLDANSQKKVVILGSSTSAGVGASSYANSWVGKFTSYFQTLNPANSVINLAFSGYGTWSVMPTGSGVGEDPDRNITKALSLNPNLIIVNLPSNDANVGAPLAVTMSRFRLLRQLALAAGVDFWLTTTQPRNFEDWKRLVAAQTKDSINFQFGAKAIDFWTTIANADGTINFNYDSGDGVHLNNAGHEILFQRAKAAINTTVLPIDFSFFQANESNNRVELRWKANRGVLKFDIEKSIDGTNFSLMTSISPVADINTVNDPAPGPVNFYRVKALSSNSVKYSQTLKVVIGNRREEVSVFPNPIYDRSLRMQFSNLSSRQVTINLINSIGIDVYRAVISATGNVTSHSVQLPENLPNGTYYLRVSNQGTQYNRTVILQ